MKITFEDGSFLEFAPNPDGSLRVILCGIKSYNKTTMSTADLSEEQVIEITNFLLEQSAKEYT